MERVTQSYTYVEPRKPAMWSPQPAFILTSCTFLHPVQGPHPVLRLGVPEIFFLLVQIRRDIMTHEREEAGDRESFIAVPKKLEIYSVVIVQVAKEGNDSVYGYHNKDADDTMPVSQS
jgi:hypothetical protein